MVEAFLVSRLDVEKRGTVNQPPEITRTIDDKWEQIKQFGSQHYKGGSIEPIDLMRDVKPHGSLTVLGIKGLGDIIKYAFRMLTKGVNEKDCDKIIHYATMMRYFTERKQ